MAKASAKGGKTSAAKSKTKAAVKKPAKSAGARPVSSKGSGAKASGKGPSTKKPSQGAVKKTNARSAAPSPKAMKPTVQATKDIKAASKGKKKPSEQSTPESVGLNEKVSPLVSQTSSDAGSGPLRQKEKTSSTSTIGAESNVEIATEIVTVAPSMLSRAPAKVEKAPRKAKSDGRAEKRSKKAAKSLAVALDKLADLGAQWNSLYERSSDLEAVPYKMSETYEARTAIMHKVLGWGYVLTSQNDRLEVLFKDGIKILISNYKG